MSSHAEGHWTYRPAKGIMLASLALEDGSTIIFKNEPRAKDARLFATAPDLLKFAIFSRDNVGPWLSAMLEDPEVCPEMKLDISHWMEIMFSAIAKATGETT